ncbi:MAG: ATPase [Chloroflexi bacterium]|nr:ATPase [Chloroflexota bacterium]
MIKIDISYLVDKLESIVNSGKRVPLSTKVMVDEQDMLDILDQMRTILPEETKQAKRTVQDREWILQQAQEEADRVIDMARKEAQDLINKDGAMVEAQSMARELLKEAEDEARRIREGADSYARQVLSELESTLSGEVQAQINKQLSAIRKGLASLSRERASA